MNRFVKRTFLGLLGGALVVAGITGCAASRWNRDPSEMSARIVERIGSKLELDTTQQQKLSVLADKLQAQRQAMRGGSDPREQFKALLAGNTFDQAGAQRLINEKSDAVRNGSPEVIAAAADFFDHLNPEQQQKVRDFMAKGHGGRFGHRG